MSRRIREVLFAADNSYLESKNEIDVWHNESLITLNKIKNLGDISVYKSDCRIFYDGEFRIMAESKHLIISIMLEHIAFNKDDINYDHVYNICEYNIVKNLDIHDKYSYYILKSKMAITIYVEKFDYYKMINNLLLIKQLFINDIVNIIIQIMCKIDDR